VSASSSAAACADILPLITITTIPGGRKEGEKGRKRKRKKKKREEGEIMIGFFARRSVQFDLYSALPGREGREKGEEKKRKGRRKYLLLKSDP